MDAEKITFQNEAEWLEFRKGGIGGSEAAVVCGASNYKSPLDLWAEKRGLVDGQVETEQMAWGRRLQGLIVQGYQEETGRVVQDQGIHTFVSKEYPYIRYSADGLIHNQVFPKAEIPVLRSAISIFEAKSTGYITAKELEEELPLDWQVQCQHGLFTLGLEHGSLAVLVKGNQLRWKDLDRNDPSCWNRILLRPSTSEYRKHRQ